MTKVAQSVKLNGVTFSQRARDLKDQERKEAEARARKRKSPFSKFYQVNKDKSKYLMVCLKDNPKALELLFFIFDHMDKYNAVVCSYKVFQEELGMSQATVARAIKYLKEKGFLYVYKSGTSNVYVANNELVWNSWGNNTQYCEFPANIVLAKSEQVGKTKVREKSQKQLHLEE